MRESQNLFCHVSMKSLSRTEGKKSKFLHLMSERENQYSNISNTTGILSQNTHSHRKSASFCLCFHSSFSETFALREWMREWGVVTKAQMEKKTCWKELSQFPAVKKKLWTFDISFHSIFLHTYTTIIIKKYS